MRRQVELGRCRIDLVRAAVQAALREVRSRHAKRASTSIRLLAHGVTPGIALTALLAAAPGEAFATDITRSNQSTSFWSSSVSWSGGVAPGAADRAIFDSTAGFSLRVDQPRTDVGQLLYTGAPAGTNFVNFSGNPSAAVLFIHGIGGVGIDIQSNYTASLFNAVGIVADQTWQAGNASGGGFITGGLGTGLVDLGSSTLTLNLVNAVNTGQLVRLIGTGNVVKTGLGKLTLTGASTFTGSTNINAGMLALSGGGAIATSSAVTVNNGATFDISATSAGTSISTLAGGGNVALGAKTLTITAGSNTFSGILSGTGGALTVAGGTEILTGASTYTGGTTIAAGATLQLGNSGSSGSIVGDVADNGTLTLSHSGGTYTFGGVISGTGSVNLSTSSTSTTTFTGTNTYTGGTTITNAALRLGNGGTTGSIVGNVAFNSGSLNFNRSDTYTFGGVISGNGAVFQFGSGTTILTGNNTYTQATEIFNGTLSVSSDANLGAPSADYVYIDNATLETTGTMTSARSIEFGSTSTISPDAGTTLTLTGQINGYDDGSLTKAGGGTLVLATDITDLGADTMISAGTLQLGNGSTTGSINGNVTDNGMLAFNRSDTSTFDGVISGSGAVNQIGPGTTVLTGSNLYTGGTRLGGGTLSVSSLGNLGSTGGLTFDGGALENTASFTLDRQGILNTGGGTLQTDADLIWSARVTGAGGLTKTGPGTLALTSDLNDYQGGTTITGGSLQIGNNGTTGSVTGNVANNGTLAFAKSNTLSFGGLISGSGTVTQVGTGTTVLSGDNTYTGGTNINAGTLRINGDQSAATGLVTVASGATLGGSGIIGGAVTVANGGHIAPGNSPGTLTMGSLTLNASSVLDFELGQANTVGGTLNDLINVNGNLTLDGTLNVTPSVGGTYGAGIYRLINYTGTLIDNGLSFGLMPAGSTNVLDTAIAHQIDLINTQGLTLNYWDGATDGRNNGQIGGGDGIWQAAGNDNWTTADGSLNAPYQSAAMPIFGSTAGTVTVDDSLGAVTVSGLQFATSGYLIQGDAITLGAGVNVVRVGDGSSAGAAYTATIASALTGAGTLDKQDLGTLVLTGANTYTGGTIISAGILQLGNGGTSGSLVGDITNNATLTFNRSDVFTLAGAISGNGEVRQVGSGTTTLTAAGSTAGRVTVGAGTLEVASGASLAANTTTVAAGATLSNSGTFTGTTGDDTFKLGGTFIGTAGLLAGNDYVQILDGANISQAHFDGGVGTDTMDVTTNSSLTLPPSLATGFENLIKHGTGTVTLSGTVDSFSDSIEVATGTLALSAATVQTSLVRIDQGATLTGTGSLSGNLSNSGVFTFGSTPGTLNVGGAYVQTATGALVSHIRPSGTDLLNVAGSATLAGTHQIQIEYGLYLNGTTQTVLQAAGGITGDYDSVQINPSALMSATRQLTANAETLSFLRQPITSITDPQSGKGRFAQWLEDNISVDALTPKMTAYIDELLQQPTAAGVERLLGERSAPPPTAAVAQNSVSMLGAGFAHSIFERFQLTDQAECIEMQTASNEAPQCFWAHGLRQWGHANGDEFGPRTDWTTDGLQVGVDRSLSESWKAGISFGYADSEIYDPTGGSNDLRARMVGVYTQYEAGPLGIGALGFYSDNNNSTRRTVDVDNTPRQALADFATNSYGIGTRLGYRLGGASGPSLRPFLEAFYNHLQGAHFGEGNAGAGNLSGNIRGREDLRGTVGVQLAQSFETNRLVFRPMIELGAAHEFRDVRSTVDLQPFSDSAAFRTSGPALDRNSYMARASLDVAVAKHAAITLGYGGEIADNYSQHEGSLSFRVAW
jgi:fibronectin-binding autotransporter adhesin